MFFVHRIEYEEEEEEEDMSFGAISRESTVRLKSLGPEPTSSKIIVETRRAAAQLSAEREN